MNVVMGGFVTYKYIRVNTREGEELFVLEDHDGTRKNGYKLTVKKGENLKGN